MIDGLAGGQKRTNGRATHESDRGAKRDVETSSTDIEKALVVGWRVRFAWAKLVATRN